MTMKRIVGAVAIAATAAAVLWSLPAPPAPPAIPPTSNAQSPAPPATGHLAAPETATSRFEAPLLPADATGEPAAAPSRGKLLGRVIDPAGVPVCPARVYAFALRNGKPTEDQPVHDDVDEHGEFELVATLDGDVLIVAIPLQPATADAKTAAMMLPPHGGLAATAVAAAMHRQQTQSLGDLQVRTTVAISGSVQGPGGEPVVGVPVGWAPEDPAWELFVEAFAITGFAGGGVHVQRLERSGGSAFAGGHATDGAGRFSIATTAGITGYVFLPNNSGEGGIECLVHERKVTAPAVVDFRLLHPACVRVLTLGKPTANQVVRFEINGGNGRDPRIENYRTDDQGELRILREREAPLRGRILRPGREPLVFDVPLDALPGSPLVVELGTAATTRVQVVLTSEVPLGTLNGALWRIDVPPAPIQLQAETGSPLVTMVAEAPPGRYRMRLAQARDAQGDDTFVIWQTADITIGEKPLQVPVRVQHGGRIRIDVKSSDGKFVPGKFRLVDAAGRESQPSLHAPGRGNGRGGELWAPGPLLTAMSALAPGRHEVVIDLGAQGTHRQFVDVRRCEIADVTIMLR